MFTGGSRVCCVDEVSSGVDPLSRRKIWDILLRERGKRTIIFTTHFLDEADLLADHIAILSKGSLRAEGSAVELKHKLGGGYRVHVHHIRGMDGLLDLGITSTYTHKDQTVYCVATSAEAAKLVDRLEHDGIDDYHVSGPSVEDVFLKLADEVEEGETLKAGEAISNPSGSSAPGYRSSAPPSRELQLLPGRRLSMLQQTWVLFRKRLTILRRNSLPYQLVLLVPIITAALVTLLLRDAKRPSCDLAQNLWEIESGAFSTILTSNNRVNVPIGPSNRFSGDSLAALQGVLPASDPQSTNSSVFSQRVQLVDTLPAFNDRINTQFANVTPGGLYLGDDGAAPTFAYKIDRSLYYSVLTQNLLNRLLTNISISTQYVSFAISIPVSWWKRPNGGSRTLFAYTNPTHFNTIISCNTAGLPLPYPLLSSPCQNQILNEIVSPNAKWCSSFNKANPWRPFLMYLFRRSRLVVLYKPLHTLASPWRRTRLSSPSILRLNGFAACALSIIAMACGVFLCGALGLHVAGFPELRDDVQFLLMAPALQACLSALRLLFRAHYQCIRSYYIRSCGQSLVPCRLPVHCVPALWYRIDYFCIYHIYVRPVAACRLWLLCCRAMVSVCIAMDFPSGRLADASRQHILLHLLHCLHVDTNLCIAWQC